MSRRNRRRHLLVGSAMVWAIASVSLPAGRVVAQPSSAPSPSPFAPGDLKRPIFDTKTPVYDTSDKRTKSAETVVAEVDGRAVTLGEVGDAIRALPPNMAGRPFEDLYPGILQQLIRQQALLVRAQRQGLDEDPEVRRKMKTASEQVLVNELLNRESAQSVTEAALLDRYNKDIAGKPGPDELRVRVIMVPTEQEALAIVGELRGGADFATVAKRSSKDATASKGGDAGFAARDQMTPEIGAVVFSLQPGQFTPLPVLSRGAWFVLKVEERRHQPARPFTMEREALRQAMVRDNVPALVAAAVADVTVRQYDIGGKEAESSAAGAGLRVPH
ncbi:MAG TPA: peptidylprolyl isomerase [Rhodopila sp.]